MPSTDDLDDATLKELVEKFYQRARADADLGPVFQAAVADWDDHHARLTDFWSSVVLGSGRYKGNPVALHMLHAPHITPEMFAKWLSLWRRTTSEHLSEPTAKLMQSKADRIATTLQQVLFRKTPAH
ncbi:MAG: hypothetical protein NPIRA05_12980 [Nitrospirales bacterium]|nr:MAG: hypothetical protein NPIRA05_12980 [Nitrospirales bacterium]